MIEQPKRGPGRPPKVETEKREPTATEQIAALDAKRFLNRGYLVDPPAEMSLAAAHRWLMEVAEVGTAGDVEIAWTHGIQNVYLKEKLRNEYDRLRDVAGQRYGKLLERAAEEQRQEQNASQERARVASRRREIAGLKARLAQLEA